MKRKVKELKHGVLITKEEFEKIVSKETAELGTELAFKDGFEPAIGFLTAQIGANLLIRLNKRLFENEEKEERKGE